jgi:hypothetical protein
MPVERKTDAAGENNSLHATKYKFDQAIGDLIDNSIDAGCKNIQIMIHDQDYTAAGSPKSQGINAKNYPKGLKYLHGEQLYVAMIDDGKGMTADDMEQALIYGFRRDYEDYELGNFGVGLKNSTLSQAYEATIVSKKNEKITCYRISSVHIQGQKIDQLLIREDMETMYPWMSKTDGFEMVMKQIKKLKSGTAILLEGLHKIEKEIGIVGDRDDYLDTIIERLKSQVGLTFHRYLLPGSKIRRTDGSFKNITPIKITINGAPVFSLDPFFTDFKDTKTNHGTLTRDLDVKTNVDGQEVKLEVKSFIIPTDTNIKKDYDAQSLNSKLLKVRPKITFKDMQGFYVYRHQRLIDFASLDPWKTLGAVHGSTAVGRWELQLPPHQANQLQELDFGIDKTKTDIPLGKTVKENLTPFWSKETYQWHLRDTAPYGASSRMKFRTTTTAGVEAKCKDCSMLGHKDKSKPKCIHYTPPPPPKPPTPPTPPTPPITPPIPPPATGGGSVTVQSVTNGELTAVAGNIVNVNLNHPVYEDIKKWFKKQP